MYKSIFIANEIEPNDDHGDDDENDDDAENDDDLPPEVLRQTSQLSVGTTLPVINDALALLNQSPIPRKKICYNYWIEKKLERTSRAVRGSLAGASTSQFVPKESEYFTDMLTQLKEKYKSPATSIEVKYQILTLLPKSWTVKQVVEEMGTTSYMATVAKRMVKDAGILSTRPPALGTYF